MSWTNGQPSPAEYAMRELRTRPLFEVLDPDHMRRVIKRAAPVLARILTGVADNKFDSPLSEMMARHFLVQLGTLDVELWSNNTFTIARLGVNLDSGRVTYGVATRMETDRPDVSVAIRLAAARALHAMLLDVTQRLDEATPGFVGTVEDELQSLGL